MPERPAVFVHLLPSLIPPGALRGSAAVVIDVLRATTVMVHALASGCEAVVPCGEIDEARAVAASLPPGTALLGGERGGLPIPGFDLGNSPGDFTPEACRGKILVMTTTNGTRAILASRAAERVLIGAFVNHAAVLEALRQERRPLHIVCAGTDGEISFEDTLCAGLIVEDLLAPARERANDPAEIAARLADSVFAQLAPGGMPLAELLRWGRGGRNVEEVGLGPDIDASAQLDRFAIVPELVRDEAPLRIVVP